MLNLPNDIIEKVKNDFRKEDWDLIFKEIENVRQDHINVGENQLIRSLLILCQGNRYKFLNIRRKQYLGDPKNVVSLANEIDPSSDYGRKPFEINKLKPGWVTEYWTRDARLSESDKKKIDTWIYSNLFTDTQYDLKPKAEDAVITLCKYYLKANSYSEMIHLNNPFTLLPNQEELEKNIYKVLISNNLSTECYWITFNQCHTYHYDRGSIGEYEFKNEKLNELGHGSLYPIYSNLFNEDVGQSFNYNYALGTGLISKDFDWFLLLHFKREKECYVEILIGGLENFKSQMKVK